MTPLASAPAFAMARVSRIKRVTAFAVRFAPVRVRMFLGSLKHKMCWVHAKLIFARVGDVEAFRFNSVRLLISDVVCT